MWAARCVETTAKRVQLCVIMTDERFSPPRNFAWLDAEDSDYDRARVVVLPVPYDSTASGWVGSREGPGAIIEASANMELYDIGIGVEPYLVGIHTLPEVALQSAGPEAMAERIEEIVGEQVDAGKFVVTLGGEHTVAVGAARAYAKRVPGLSVLAFDANADMRDSYLDSEYNHACTLRRIGEAVGTDKLVEVGLRSAEREEHEYILEKGMRFFGPREFRSLGPAGVSALLSENVYITFDLDAFDSSVISALGTPEPGGLHWDEVSDLLETVAREHRIVGFDVTELAPSLGPRANAQLAAKLAYRLIGLAVRE
jgi:agmatinase